MSAASSPINHYTNCNVSITSNCNNTTNNNYHAPTTSSNTDDTDSSEANANDASSKKKKEIANVIPNRKPEYIPVTVDENGAVVLPHRMIPTSMGETSKTGLTDDHLKQYLHFLPYLDNNYKDNKGQKLEPSSDVIVKLRTALTGIMQSTKQSARNAIRSKIITNFEKETTKSECNELCHSISDVKRFIGGDYSREQMKKNPYFVSKMLIDHVLHETSSGSKFKNTLMDAIIDVGSSATPRWTIDKKEGEHHSLVQYANKACIDYIKPVKKAEEDNYGVTTSLRKPKPKERKPNHIYARVDHGYGTVYLRLNKTKIRGLEGEIKTPPMDRLKGILMSSFAGSDQNEKQEGPETKEEKPSVQNEAYSNNKDVAEKQMLEHPEKVKACSEKLQIDPFKPMNIEKIKACAEKLQIDPSTVVQCIQMALPRTPEYNESPCSFGSKRNAQDDGADSDNGYVASQVDATHNEKFEDILALSDKDWEVVEESTHSFLDDDSKAEVKAKQTLTKSTPKVTEATAPQTQKNDPSKVKVLAVTTTGPRSTNKDGTRPQAKQAQTDGLSKVHVPADVPQTQTNDTSEVNVLAVTTTGSGSTNKEGTGPQAKQAQTNGLSKVNVSADATTGTGSIKTTKATTATDEKESELPPGFCKVLKVHARKKKSRGKKSWFEYFVEWAEDCNGQWGSERYTWEKLNLKDLAVTEFLRDYQEMGSTVRGTLIPSFLLIYFSMLIVFTIHFVSSKTK